MPAMTLRYLDFDYSEDAEGTGTWDAMASVTPSHLPAVLAELALVLDWAHNSFPGQRGPMEEGGEWDYDLQGIQEVLCTLQLHYDEDTRQIQLQKYPPGMPRNTVTLSLSGTPAFSQALRAQFALD